MEPEAFVERILDPGLHVLHRLGGPAVTDAARHFLLAVILQESGPGLNARFQHSPATTPGPARGWAQFEQGGGVQGVLTHAASRTLAALLCAECSVVPAAAACWRALEGHDVLSIGFARLLLWTDPHPIPVTQEAAWECYATRLWRPGRPHPQRWAGNWATAGAAIRAASIMEEVAAPEVAADPLADILRRIEALEQRMEGV